VSGTLGSLLQGVSQQPAHIRNDGQVTEQINMVSDVVRGLTSRPATELVAYNAGATPALTFRNVTIGGERFQIGFEAGNLEVIDSLGVSRTVTLDAGVSAYIGAGMEVYVYDNVTYLLNRDQVVAMDASTAAAEAEVVKDEGLVTSLGGEFSHTYTVTLEYSDGTKAVGTYTVPDGTTAGDASQAASTYIVEQLDISLSGHANIKAGTLVTTEGSTLRITGAPDLKVTTTDGSGGTLLRSQSNVVDSTADLAKFAPHGTLVRVEGGKGDEDDFWMRFEVEGATVGASFGSEGTWREWFNPSEPSNFDLATMPHVMVLSGGAFTVSKGNWQGRRVGDSVTNPEPSFVGETIRDINGFQSRLVVIAGPHVVMTRTNIEVDFWKESATLESASDPIDIMSTAETEFALEWIVPFDRDLILFADSSQFIITGSAALTGSNASMVQTTNFEMGNAARPASTGRTLLFPFSNGGFAGVKEFFSSAGTDASDAVSITQVQDEYMRGAVTKLTASTNFSFVLVQTDHVDEQKTLFVHQYYYSGEEKAQASWSRWDFPYTVVNVFFSGSQLYILMYDATLGYIQTTLDLDIPDNVETGYPVTLDVLGAYTAATVSGEYVLPDYVDITYAETGIADANSTFIDLPWNDARVVQGTGCTIPGQTANAVVTDLGGGTYRYLLENTSVPDSATVLAGLPYTSAVLPTMPFIRDKTGAAITRSKLVVTEFIAYFEESGYINSTMTSKYRSTPLVYSNAEIVTANDPDDPAGKGIRSGQYKIPWGERSDWSELTISSDDVRPMTIIEVEWIGQVLTRGRRL
ncbi:MAG: hypothetical protein P8P29_01515, partial [Flavobacteriaceae bacterium]|nr:hypothetical protein [Flavobacteriaceae bacterium]